jgi:hypothetical protein
MYMVYKECVCVCVCVCVWGRENRKEEREHSREGQRQLKKPAYVL